MPDHIQSERQAGRQHPLERFSRGNFRNICEDFNSAFRYDFEGWGREHTETEGERTLQDKEFQFYMKESLTCEMPMEESYFQGQRLYHKRNKNSCSCCGLEENHIQKPTVQETRDYSCVYHPCTACKNNEMIKAKPLYGSRNRKRRQERMNAEVFDSENLSTATAAAAPGSEIMSLMVEDAETEPSGDFSEPFDSE